MRKTDWEDKNEYTLAMKKVGLCFYFPPPCRCRKGKKIKGGGVAQKNHNTCDMLQQNLLLCQSLLVSMGLLFWGCWSKCNTSVCVGFCPCVRRFLFPPFMNISTVKRERKKKKKKKKGSCFSCSKEGSKLFLILLCSLHCLISST